jgi:acyl dehydratase
MSQSALRSIEEINIGDNIGPEPLFLSKDRVRAYCNAAGLAGVPRFTDDEGARKEGLPGMITPGNMSAALICKASSPRSIAPSAPLSSTSG